MNTHDKIREISTQTQCGLSLSRDLLILAGEDEHLVIESSKIATGINHLKSLIIDARFRQVAASINHLQTLINEAKFKEDYK